MVYHRQVSSFQFAPFYLTVNGRVAAILDTNGLSQAAEEYLVATVALDPSYAPALVHLGVALTRRGDQLALVHPMYPNIWT